MKRAVVRKLSGGVTEEEANMSLTSTGASSEQRRESQLAHGRMNQRQILSIFFFFFFFLYVVFPCFIQWLASDAVTG
jgi:hypothetical protein